jgi:ketosteroid isomerase-like protein
MEKEKTRKNQAGPKSNKSNPLIENFMRCLREAEQSHDLNSLCDLFTDDADMLNLTRQRSSGAKGHQPRPFWSHYVGAFEKVESHFTNVIDDGRHAVLEWHSIGRLPMGLPVEYNGVSILEYRNGKIHRFRTYYDSAAFQALGHLGHHYSQSVGKPEITNQATS